MHRAARAGVFIAAAAWATAGAAHAASFDCKGNRLVRAEITICIDRTLSSLDEKAARRFNRIARNTRFGPYLGLRHWRANWIRSRNTCGTDRACIAAHYRAKTSFLDRLQRCFESRLTRTTCVRRALNGERETGRLR